MGLLDSLLPENMVSYTSGLLLLCLYHIGSSLPSPQQTGLSPLSSELDGLLMATGEIPSVDLEKRAPMRFGKRMMNFSKKAPMRFGKRAPMRFGKRAPMRFGKRDYEESDPTELLYEDMYFDKRAPMRFGKRADDYFY